VDRREATPPAVFRAVFRVVFLGVKKLLLPRVLALTTLLVGAAACARPEQVLPPPKLVPKPEMVTLLVQLHVLEARLENVRLSPDSARALFLSQQRELFWQHNITPDDSAFVRSYRYYATHDKDLDGIYAQVLDSLTARVKKAGGTPLPKHY